VSEPGGLGKWALLAWVVAAAALVLGLSVAIGYVGPKKAFMWELAAISGTAFATTLLAGATGALAYSTRSDVRATWQLAELTQRDQAERQRPVVIQKRAVYAGSGSMGGRVEGPLEVTLRNVGLGPALGVAVTATYADANYEPVITPNPYIIPAIAANGEESFTMTVVFDPSPKEGVRGDWFPLTGKFTDRSRQGSYEIITEW